MVQVAREAGCSVGNLYKRFAGKDAFLNVLVDSVRQRLIGEIDAMGGPGRGSGHACVNQECGPGALETIEKRGCLTVMLHCLNVHPNHLRQPADDDPPDPVVATFGIADPDDDDAVTAHPLVSSMRSSLRKWVEQEIQGS